MVKAKRAGKFLRRSLLLLLTALILVVIASLLLLLPVVQTRLAQWLSGRLSDDLGTSIRIERVELRLFGANRLHGLYIADLNGDTLIAADEVWLRGVRVKPNERLFEASRLELYRSRFALLKDSGNVQSNLTLLLEKLSGTDTATTAAEPWRIQCRSVDIRELHFSYADANIDPIPYGVDVDHVDIPSANIRGHDLLFSGDSVLIGLEEVSLADRSGLVVEHLSGAARVSGKGVRIKDLHLVTGPQIAGAVGSDLRGDLDLRSIRFSDFDEFNTRVMMEARLDSSRLQFADVALFAPDLQGVDLPITLRGNIQGKVNELKGRDMDLYFGERSSFHGDVELSGLPDVPNTFIVLDAESISTDPEDLASLPVPPFLQKRTLQLPQEVKRLGAMAYTGNFTGFINSFTTYGTAATQAGTLRTDISYDSDTVSERFELRGKLATTGIDLGLIFGTSSVGKIAFDTEVKAKGPNFRSLEAELQGEVSRLNVAGMAIGGITLNGKLEKDLFNGVLHCDDPKLLLDFNGLADLRGKWPLVDFTAHVQRMDMRALGLIAGTGYSDLAMQVQAKGSLAPDSLEGEIHLKEVSFCLDSVDLELGDIAVNAWRDQGVPVLTVESGMADASVRGTFYPTLLHGAVESVVYSVFPALQDQVVYAQEEQAFTYDVTIKHAQPLLDLLLPGLVVAEGTHASGSFDSRTFDLGLDAWIPYIGYGGLMGDSLVIGVDKTMDLLSFSIRGNGSSRKDSIAMKDLDITGKAYQDEVRIGADWRDATGPANGTINIDALVHGPRSISIDLEPSRLTFGQGDWTNERTARLRVDSNTVTIDTLEMRNAGQSIRLGGMISPDPDKALTFDLHDVRLDNLRPFYDGPAVHGRLSGDGRIFALYGDPYLLSYLCVDSLAIEGHPVGDLRFAAAYSEGSDAINVNGTLQRGNLQALTFSGKLDPGKEEELALKLKLDQFDLRFIDPYLPEDISDIQGMLSGSIDVTGKLSDPQINGSVLMENAGLRINYLNTFYSFTHQMEIRPDMFRLDLVKLQDEEGHTAIANGAIIHKGLKDWNFDVSMDMENLMVLNTDESRNELYYGKAYATGNMGLSGYADQLEILVDAATAPGTDIHFPLGASREVGGITFIHFIGAGDDTDVERVVDLSGLSLDMNVKVTPDARFELIFDPTVGDIMQGRGEGNIALSITSAGDLSMKGGVELVDGNYLFTLRNLVNKRFSVETGGRINWYGDPFDATIDIDAVYRLRAGLYDVMPPALRTEAYKKRVPVEVLMHLSQKLMNPDIAFDVRVPTVDEGVRTQVKSALSTTDEMNKQVFALIVLNRFLPADATAAPTENSEIGSGVSTTGSELFSNQVSNWLSSFSDKFDLGVNWRTGDVLSQDEFELAVSTAIFNDRLQVNTNVGLAYGDGGTQSGNALIGDFSAEYLITQGKLRFKAFSQSNDRNLEQIEQSSTTQGIGLAYKVEFDTLLELLGWKKKPEGE